MKAKFRILSRRQACGRYHWIVVAPSGLIHVLSHVADKSLAEVFEALTISLAIMQHGRRFSVRAYLN